MTNQEDQFWYESILASVGMNKNDDIFTKADLWNARLTPVNKPVNHMHDNDDRIGHMVASAAIDVDGNVISNELTLDEVPDQFDIVTAAVLYKLWDDPEKLARSQKIFEEIAEGQWKVSMECRFNDFDYGLTNTATGEDIIVKRDESTAFLTQFLRIYEGVGEWKGYKIGRVLRNFYFSAKGLVRNPANPRSLILTEANFSSANVKTINEIEEKSMAENTDVNKTLVDELKTAHASEVSRMSNDMKSINEQLAKTKAELEEKEQSLKDSYAEYDKTEKEKDEEKKKREKMEASLTEATEAKEKAETEAAEAKEAVAKLEKEVEAMKQEKVQAERYNKLVQAKVEEAEAKELLETWADVSEERFDSVVALIKDRQKEEESSEASEFDFESKADESEGQFSAPEKGSKGKNELKDLFSTLAANFNEKK